MDEISKIKKLRFTPMEIGKHYLNARFGSDVILGNRKVSCFVLIKFKYQVHQWN